MAKILSIETSCDETSIAILDWQGERTFTTLSHLIHSQESLHARYGGVFPAMARREHKKNIIPLLFASLEEAALLSPRPKVQPLEATLRKKVVSILDRDPDIAEKIILLAEQYKSPNIQAIAVTYGPGLEIALWTGFNTARALVAIWGGDLVPSNHMEGHIYASLIKGDEDQKQKSELNIQNSKFKIQNLSYPSLALLISGGHTELVLIKAEHDYKIIGQTLDDAVGEAYDKSARLIGLPYPGGPKISEQAELAKQFGVVPTIELPRPLLHNKDYNFSFSGLKTAVRQVVEKQTRLSKKFKQGLSCEFEEAVAEVLKKKTARAIDEFGVKNLIIGGGVSANTNVRSVFTKLCKEKKTNLFLPDPSLSGDNALMINLAGYRRWKKNTYPKRVSKVKGNLQLN